MRTELTSRSTATGAGRGAAARTPPCYVGWLVGDEGAAAVRCNISDVSRGGAKLRLFGASNVPDEFTLHFSRTGDAHIRCRVRWRDACEAGVEFPTA